MGDRIQLEWLPPPHLDTPLIHLRIPQNLPSLPPPPTYWHLMKIALGGIQRKVGMYLIEIQKNEST